MQTEAIQFEAGSARQDQSVRSGGHGWHLLHVEANDIDAMKVKLALQYDLPPGSRIQPVGTYEEAQNALDAGHWDAVLVGRFAAVETDADALARFIDANPGLPVLVLSASDDPQAALVAGQCGAREYLLKSKLSGSTLAQALDSALRQPGVKPGQAAIDRRKEPRYQIARSAIVFPLQSDGRPGREVIATTFDISSGGISVLAEAGADQLPERCLVGVENVDGTYHYASVEWRWRRLALPAVRLGGRFLSRVDDPFHPSQLAPRFDPIRLQYVPPLDAAVLAEWTSRGILRPRAVDRVLTCPDCQSLPTFRFGCPQCGSAQTHLERLIHHFACAVVRPVDDFETVGGLVCPKCQARNLVVGADFEYLDGPHYCDECDWSAGELESIGECMRCGKRFLGSDAVASEVFEYQLARLNPQAVIDALPQG